MIDKKIFDNWIKKNDRIIERRFLQYLAINTVSPNENNAFSFLHEYLSEIGFATREDSLQPDLLHHPAACPVPFSKISAESKNFHASKGVADNIKSVLVSCHIDVVPAGEKWKDAFCPYVKENAVYGRGACDTKGNFIMFAEAIKFLHEIGIPLKKNILFDGVIEEEIGGNGALSAILKNQHCPYGVLVLEPTSLECFRGHRGCIGFSVTVFGKETHMGTATQGQGTLHAMVRLIDALAAVEKELIEETRLEPAFDIWPRPVQVNIGKIAGGEWHGSSMASCCIMVNMGFPPSVGLQKAQHLVLELVDKQKKMYGLEYKLQFDGIRNDAYLDKDNNTFFSDFTHALTNSGIAANTSSAWNVSCDARHYSNYMKVPTLIFGCGDLADSHSPYEKVNLGQVYKGMFALASYFSSS